MLPPRIDSKVARQEAGGCWLWTGALNGSGYGCLKVSGNVVRAHRYVYEALVGPIPDGMHLDHLCRVRDCVNPEHLEPVTQAENNRRAHESKAHCPNGHPRVPENLQLCTTSGRSFLACRICRKARNRPPYLTACMAGHVRTAENTFIRSDGQPRCLVCTPGYGKWVAA